MKEISVNEEHYRLKQRHERLQIAHMALLNAAKLVAECTAVSNGSTPLRMQILRKVIKQEESDG